MVFMCVGRELKISLKNVAFLPFHFFTTSLEVIVQIFRASGLPHVCKLWLMVSKGMFPVIRLAPDIPMAVDYYGCRLARRQLLATPAFLGAKCATVPLAEHS